MSLILLVYSIFFKRKILAYLTASRPQPPQTENGAYSGENKNKGKAMCIAPARLHTNKLKQKIDIT